MTEQYLDAESCPHEYHAEGDELHVAGDPVDMICLASPICAGCGAWVTGYGHIAIVRHNDDGTHEVVPADVESRIQRATCGRLCGYQGCVSARPDTECAQGAPTDSSPR